MLRTIEHCPSEVIPRGLLESGFVLKCPDISKALENIIGRAVS